MSVPPPEPKRRSAFVWVSSTYFAEGFPYAVVINLADALFVRLGASLAAIGLTALFHLPWNLKFLWGPLLDQYETKRRWMVACEFVLAVILVAFALLMNSEHVIVFASIAFVVMAVVAATHDIAIDGFYLEALDEAKQSELVGLRAAWYRVATIAAFGGFLIVAGYLGWVTAWLLATAVMLGLAIFHRMYLPRIETPKRPIGQLLRAALQPRVLIFGVVIATIVLLRRQLAFIGVLWADGTDVVVGAFPFVGRINVSGWIGLLLLTALLIVLAFVGRIRRTIERGNSEYGRAFVDFLGQPRIGMALAFVVTFRLGESFLLKMRLPFLLKEVGMTEATYGLLNGTFGFGAMIVGSLLGGYLISRQGLRRWLWPFVLAQNGLNLLYMGLAMLPDPSAATMNMLSFVVLIENFGAGLGTAVFMIYIMRCCDPRHRAAHMAIVSALMSVGFTVAGVASGFIASEIGYARYFGFTFLATIPSMALIPFIPHLDGREGSPQAEDK